MIVEQMSFSFQTMQWIVITVVAVYSWLIGRQAASAKELLELRTRITALEAEMKQVPSETRISELVGRLERVDATLEGFATRLEPISRSLDRINDYLLNNK